MKGGLFVCTVTRKGGLFVCPASLEKSADCFIILCVIWQATADNKEDPKCELLEIEGNRLDALTFQSLLSDFRVHISDISMQDALGFNYVSPPLNTMLFQVTSAATDQDTGDTTSNSNSGSTSSQQTSNSNGKQEATQASSGSGKGGKQKKDTIGSSSEGGGDDDENRKKKDEKLQHDSISRASKKAERKRLLEEEKAAWLIRQAELLAGSEEDEESESNSQQAQNETLLAPLLQSAQNETLLAPLLQSAQNETLLAPLLQSAQNDTLLTPLLQSAPNASSPAQHASSPAPNASSLAQHASSPAPNASSPAPNAVSPAPNASSPAPNASSLAPNASSLAQHASSPAPNASLPAPNAVSAAQHATDILASTLASLFPTTHFSSTVVANNGASTSEDSSTEVNRSNTPLSLISAASDQVAGSGDARSTASSPGPSTPKPPTPVTSPNIDFNAWETTFGCPLSTPRSSAGEGGNASQHPQTILPNEEIVSTSDPTPAPCTTALGCPLSTPRSSAGEGGNASQHPQTILPDEEIVSTPDPTPAPCTTTFGCPLSTPRPSAGEGGNAWQHPQTIVPNEEIVSTPDPTPAPCTRTSPAQVVATPKKRVVNCKACKRGKKTCPKCVDFHTSVSASAELNEAASISMSARRRSRNSSAPSESTEAVSTELNTQTARVSRRHRSRAAMHPLQSSDVVLNHSSSPREISEVNSQQLHTHNTTSPTPFVVQQPQNQVFLNNTATSNVNHTPWTSMGAATGSYLPLFAESNNIGVVNGAASGATSDTNAFPIRNHTHSVMVCNVCIRACTCVICYTSRSVCINDVCTP